MMVESRDCTDTVLYCTVQLVPHYNIVQHTGGETQWRLVVGGGARPPHTIMSLVEEQS